MRSCGPAALTCLETAYSFSAGWKESDIACAGLFHDFGGLLFFYTKDSPALYANIFQQVFAFSVAIGWQGKWLYNYSDMKICGGGCALNSLLSIANVRRIVKNRRQTEIAVLSEDGVYYLESVHASSHAELKKNGTEYVVGRFDSKEKNFYAVKIIGDPATLKEICYDLQMEIPASVSVEMEGNCLNLCSSGCGFDNSLKQLCDIADTDPEELQLCCFNENTRSALLSDRFSAQQINRFLSFGHNIRQPENYNGALGEKLYELYKKYSSRQISMF